MQEMQVGSLGQEDPLEEGMAIHYNTLAWRIPRTKEPGGLQSTASESDTTEQLTLKIKYPLGDNFSHPTSVVHIVIS